MKINNKLLINNINYNIINNLINQFIIKYKIKKGMKVAIKMNKSYKLIVAIASLINIGAIYIPIDISYPEERVNSIITECNINILITDNNITYFNKKIENNTNIAYILYTSGSTGKPKGVVNCIDSLINELEWFNKSFDLKNEKILQKTPIGFDASTWEIYLPLYIGMHIITCDNSIIKEPYILAKKIIDNKISVLQIVPSISYYLVKEIKKIDKNYKLKYIFCGGESLSYKQCDLLLTISHNVINLYGPSECCCNTLYHQYKVEDKYIYKGLYCPIGKPIDNVRCYIDKNNILYIAGIAVGKGYISNNNELFYEKFNEKRIYKTNDIVTYNKDVYIFKNRLDNQVKINGQRLELEEIENIILKHPFINECKIIYENILICYYTPKNIDNKILKNMCLSFLPKYMIPNKFIGFDKFPTAFNGKISFKNIKNNHIDNVDNIDYINFIALICSCIDISKEELQNNIESNGIDSLKIIKLLHYINNKYKYISYKEFSKYKTFSDLYNTLLTPITNDIKIIYIDLDTLIKPITNNKIIVIHSSLQSLKDHIDITQLKHIINKRVDEGCTFLFPTYTLSFCKYKYYHYKWSKSETGMLGDLIDNTIRTCNPIYSWKIIGDNYICNKLQKCNNKSAFGKDTVFDYLYKNDCTYILLGCKHFTQLHYCEERAKVKWRFNKRFNGIVNYGEENIDKYIDMYVRKLDQPSKLKFKYIDYLIREKQIKNLYNLDIYKFKCNSITNILIDALQSNNITPDL